MFIKVKVESNSRENDTKTGAGLTDFYIPETQKAWERERERERGDGA